MTCGCAGDIMVSGLEQEISKPSSNYIHFSTNTLEKFMNLFLLTPSII